MIYFAYGSNLNIENMARRCPRAKPISSMVLRDSKLIFRGVADCIYAEGEKTHGGIWKITAECERALDIYEGVASSLYRKEYVQITGIPGEKRMLLYVMNSTGIYPPSQTYLDTIIQGYRDFGLPMAALKRAVRQSWMDKNPTHLERARRRRTGRPQLGLSKTVPDTGLPSTGNLNGTSSERNA